VQVSGRRLIRSATSVAANHRAAARGRSRQEFAAKIGIVREEADETQFWLELLRDSGLVRADSVEALLQEANELTAIFTASYQTAKSRR
jgi:four helix bundle protein